MSDNTMTLNDGTNEIIISVPVFGYKTVIDMGFQVQSLSNGKWDSYDSGAGYDARMCECDIVLDSGDIAELQDFLSDSSKARADNTVTLTPGGGFFPFGPDKGDDGPFTVGLEMLSVDGIGVAPLNYFTRKLRIIHTGTYPAYSLPTEISEGSLTIGTITNCRFPPSWFAPAIFYASSASMNMDGGVDFVDAGSSADRFETGYKCVMNESKAAAVIDYLTGTARGSTFSLITASNQYAFGYDKGTSTTHTVRLLKNQITVEHIQHNRFTFDLHLGWES